MHQQIGPINKHQDQDQPHLQIDRPGTYFNLIQRVGNSGKYQTNMSILFNIVLFVSATMLLSTSFLFLNKQYECENQGLLATNFYQVKNDKIFLFFNQMDYIQQLSSSALSFDRLGYIKRSQTTSNNKQQQNLSVLDLFKYSSLRFTTIATCVLSYLNFSMYYGPQLIISKIGFNIFVSSFVLSISQLLVYIPSYFYIDDIVRKKASLIVFITATTSSAILIFVQKPENCQNCWQSIVELAVIFVYRSAVSFYYMFFGLYLVQLFPSKISGLGNGFVSTAATIGSTTAPLIIGSLQRANFNVMILFCCYGVIGMMISSLLKQTKGKKIQAQIQQIRLQKYKLLLEEQRSSNCLINQQIKALE